MASKGRSRLSRGAFTVFFVLILAAAVTGWLDDVLEPYAPVELGREQLTTSLTSAIAAYASARAVNAILSVAQSSEVSAGIGVSGSVSIGQALDPIDDLVEQFSAVLLWVIGLIGAEIVLMNIGDKIGFSILLPIAAGTAIAAIWLTPHRSNPWFRNAAIATAVMAFLLKAGLPLALVASSAIANTYLEPIRVEATQALDRYQNVLPDPSAAAGSGTWIERQIEFADSLSASVGSAIDQAPEAIQAMIDLMIVYVIESFVLPLLCLIGAWMIVRTIVNALFRDGPLPPRTRLTRSSPAADDEAPERT